MVIQRARLVKTKSKPMYFYVKVNAELLVSKNNPLLNGFKFQLTLKAAKEVLKSKMSQLFYNDVDMREFLTGPVGLTL